MADLKDDLSVLLPARRVLTRPIDRIAYASDASLYRLVPKAVVRAQSVEEVRSLFTYSQQAGIPLVFRAAGTSLSGQAITDGILVDLSRSWRRVRVEENGDQVRLEPGVIGSYANLALAPFHRRIGPDPASIDAAMIGGIIANNSSGMCCGVVENSYHTLRSITMVLPNGLVLDTGDPACAEMFQGQAPEIFKGLLELKQQIEADPQLKARIRARYQQKNTTGYSLNAFLDFDEPHQILAHLMVGSEGTLGFIAEVVLKTLPAYPYKDTGLVLFESVREAAQAVYPLRDSGARAIEIMDRASLRSVETEAGLAGLPPRAAALLVEYQGNTEDEMLEFREERDRSCESIRVLSPAAFTTDPAQQARLWKIRKGLYPSIGGMRPQGATVVIEDVGFPVEQLGDATLDLQALFQKHHYPNAIIFGHAKDGNLHFVLTPAFTTEHNVRQYGRFMEDMVDLVTGKYDGALKAEHGTGRNMAPFVEREWGDEAYQIMARVKALLDPSNLLNPGVIINPNPSANLTDLKTWTTVEPEVDLCMECGFCEPSCPSRDLTLTPRRRIVVRREIARLMKTGEAPDLLASLIRDYQYDGMDTCAVDGSCALPCPIHINTGLLVKRLRAEQIDPRGQSIAVGIAKHFRTAESLVRLGVAAGHLGSSVVGDRGVIAVTRLAQETLRTVIPKWSSKVPRANFHPLPRGGQQNPEVVYFPACISRVMGTSPKNGERTLVDTVVVVSERAGLKIITPPDSPGHCCGMPFSSKGYSAAASEMLHRTVGKFWDWSDHGHLPVVLDASSCAYTLLTCRDQLLPDDREKYDELKLLDPIDYLFSLVIPRLSLHALNTPVVLHPTCSAMKLGLQEKMVAIASACAASVTVPIQLGCCGFAGDRGLLFPELTASASQLEAEEVSIQEYGGYYSSNLTCEMGMSQATEKPYQSIFYLVEAASR